jgi:hypothetical protein
MLKVRRIALYAILIALSALLLPLGQSSPASAGTASQTGGTGVAAGTVPRGSAGPDQTQSLPDASKVLKTTGGPAVMHSPLELPTCKTSKPQNATFASTSKHHRVSISSTFSCPTIDRSAIGKPSAAAKRTTKSNAASAQAGSISIPSICPSVLSGTVVFNRFDMCIDAQLSTNYEVLEGGTVIATVPLTFDVEMWAVLVPNSRTWVVYANIATVGGAIDQALLSDELLLHGIVTDGPLTVSMTGSWLCTDPSCVEVSSSGGELGDFTGDGTAQTMDGYFSDPTTATTYFDNILHVDVTGAIATTPQVDPSGTATTRRSESTATTASTPTRPANTRSPMRSPRRWPPTTGSAAHPARRPACRQSR